MARNSNRTKFSALALALFALFASQTAGAKTVKGDKSPRHPASKDIVETAAAAGTFNTLARALQAVGPIPLVAPTDESARHLRTKKERMGQLLELAS